MVIPDLPGCFSAGDTLDEAIANAPEAIALWLEDVVERGEVAPAAKSIETHRKNPEFEGWIWTVIGVDLLKEPVPSGQPSRRWPTAVGHTPKM